MLRFMKSLWKQYGSEPHLPWPAPRPSTRTALPITPERIAESIAAQERLLESWGLSYTPE